MISDIQFLAEAVASILRTKLFPNSTFDAIYNFTGFNTEDEMVTDLQSYKTLGENEGCFRAGAGKRFMFGKLKGMRVLLLCALTK